MQADGTNTNSTIVATTPSATMPTVKEQIARLKKLQDKVWAILGLKMATDRLKGLGYDVVVQYDGKCATMSVELNIDFNFDTGFMAGRDVDEVQLELKRQIEALEGKEGKNGKK